MLACEVETDSLAVSFEPVPPNEADKFGWRVHVGWMDADWETRSPSTWYVQCYLPESVFEELSADYWAGRLGAFAFGIKGGMWAPWSPLPLLDRTKWHLLPNERGSSAHAMSRVNSLIWGDKRLPLDDDDPGDAPSPTESPETTAPGAAQAASPLAAIMTAGTRANEQLAKTWTWGMPAVVLLLAIIAFRM